MEKARKEAVRLPADARHAHHRASPRANTRGRYLTRHGGLRVVSRPPLTPSFRLPSVTQESTKAYVASKREEIRPELKTATDSAEPSLKEFMAHPQVQYLKQNPKAIAAFCIPGAASVSAPVSLIGPVEMLFPMVMMMVNPVAEVVT